LALSLFIYVYMYMCVRECVSVRERGNAFVSEGLMACSLALSLFRYVYMYISVPIYI